MCRNSIESESAGDVDYYPGSAFTHIRNDGLHERQWAEEVRIHLRLRVLKAEEAL